MPSKPTRIGRPPSPNPRRHSVNVRLTAAERLALAAAAAKAGLSLAAYLLRHGAPRVDATRAA